MSVNKCEKRAGRTKNGEKHQQIDEDSAPDHKSIQYEIFSQNESINKNPLVILYIHFVQHMKYSVSIHLCAQNKCNNSSDISEMRSKLFRNGSSHCSCELSSRLCINTEISAIRAASRKNVSLFYVGQEIRVHLPVNKDCEPFWLIFSFIMYLIGYSLWFCLFRIFGKWIDCVSITHTVDTIFLIVIDFDDSIRIDWIRINCWAMKVYYGLYEHKNGQMRKYNTCNTNETKTNRRI